MNRYETVKITLENFKTYKSIEIFSSFISAFGTLVSPRASNLKIFSPPRNVFP